MFSFGVFVAPLGCKILYYIYIKVSIIYLTAMKKENAMPESVLAPPDFFDKFDFRLFRNIFIYRRGWPRRTAAEAG
jgi:hypothetical protein